MDGDRATEFTPFYIECAEIAKLKVYNLIVFTVFISKIYHRELQFPLSA